MGNFQLAVCFLSESHDEEQFSWNFCSCLQDVSNSSLLKKALLVSIMCSKNRKEWNGIQYMTIGHSSDQFEHTFFLERLCSSI